MNTTTKSTQRIVLTGMFTALLAVLSQIQIPMPSGMPLTLQTYAVALIGFMLGSRYGVWTIGIYILAGAVGLPVFTGFQGGLGKIVGTTGGFIWGFLFLAAGCGMAVRRISIEKSTEAGRNNSAAGGKNTPAGKGNGIFRILCPALGLLICHVLGTAQFALVMDMGLLQAFLLVSVPYLIKDILSVIVAYVTMKALRKRLDCSGFCA